jgi:hypothetical protein
MYWNFVAIDGVIKNQINKQQDETLKVKKVFLQCNILDTKLTGKQGCVSMQSYQQLSSRKNLSAWRRHDRLVRAFTAQEHNFASFGDM